MARDLRNILTRWISKAPLLIQSNSVDFIVFILLIAILVLSPLPLGSTPFWAIGSILSLIFLALITWSLARLFSPNKAIHRNSPLLYALLAFTGLVLFQILPIPNSLLKLLSPWTYELLSDLLPSSTSFRSLSLASFSTFREFFKIMGYTALYFLIQNIFYSHQRLKALYIVIMLIGSFEALYGLLEHFAGTHQIFSYTNPYSLTATGTFINRNHYSAYLGLCFWVTVGILSVEVSKASIKTETWKERILCITSEHAARIFLLIFISASMALAIFLSGSRGGFFSLGLGFCCFFFLAILSTRVSHKILLAWLVIAIILGLYILWLKEYPLAERWLRLIREESFGESFRWAIWKDTLQMAAHFPLLGVGAGAYPEVFPIFQSLVGIPAGVIGGYYVNHAHNDILELLTETGILGVSLISCAIVLTTLRFLKTIRTRQEYSQHFLHIGSASGIFAFLVHSIFDFNTHIPSNMILLFFVLGLCASQSKLGISNVQRRYSKTEVLERRTRWGPARIILLGIICISLWVSITSYRWARADFLLKRIERQLKNRSTEGIKTLLKEALSYCPHDPRVWLYQALVLKQDYKKDSEKRLTTHGYYDLMLIYLNKAIQLNPTNANLHIKLGVILIGLGQVIEKYGDKAKAKAYFQNALKSFNHAGTLAPRNPKITEKRNSGYKLLRHYIK